LKSLIPQSTKAIKPIQCMTDCDRTECDLKNSSRVREADWPQ